MSDVTVEQILAHYGTKGMKWGVRKDKGHEGERAKTKKIAKLDKKFEKNANTFATVVKIHNRAAQLTNDNDVDRINNLPRYKNADFSRDSPLRQRYYKEHQDAFLNNVEKAASEFGTNASGTKKYKIVETQDGGWDIFVSDVKHADGEEEPEFHVIVKYTPNGHIAAIELPKLEQSFIDLEAFLAHYGVKGQKWGVRKKTRTPSEQHQKLKALKKHKGFELTNDEIQTALTRANLETRYSQINPSAIKKGQAVVATALAAGATANAVIAFSRSPAGQKIAATLASKSKG